MKQETLNNILRINVDGCKVSELRIHTLSTIPGYIFPKKTRHIDDHPKKPKTELASINR